LTDELDFDEPPPRGRASGRRRSRRGGYQQSKKAPVGLLTMVPPSVRRAARRKLLDFHGVTLPRCAGLATIARAVAVALALPVPKDFAESSKLVLGFARLSVVPSHLVALAERPFVPLRVSPEMERALERTRAARDAGSSLDETSDRRARVPE